jgi:putative FmdB family regulatory protein
MPIYRYKCTECGYEFSLLKNINDTSEVKCEKCGGKAKKLISNVGVKFNASGFYSTTVGKGALQSKSATSGSKKDKATSKKE